MEYRGDDYGISQRNFAYITQKRLTDAFKMTSCSTYTNGRLEDDDGAKHICKGRRVDKRSKGPKIFHMVYKIRKWKLTE